MHRLFMTWVNLCHAYLDGVPALYAAALTRDEDAVQRAFDTITARVGDLPDGVMPLLFEAMRILVGTLLDAQGEFRYGDVVGQVYMDAGACETLGQFFTPSSVAECAAKILLGGGAAEAQHRHNFERQCETDPAFHALALVTGLFFTGDDALAATPRMAERHAAMLRQVEPVRVLDPCCGSGVMLVAAASVVPRWMIDAGFIEFWGVDIDPDCVAMASLNCRLHGLNASHVALARNLALAEIALLPWPWRDLYRGMLTEPDRLAYWTEGVSLARVGRLGEWEGLPALAAAETEQQTAAPVVAPDDAETKHILHGDSLAPVEPGRSIPVG